MRRIPESALLLAAVTILGCRGADAPDRSAPRPPVEARAVVEPDVATTGDLLTYRIRVEHDPAVAVEMPEPGARIGGLAVVDLGGERGGGSGDRVREERWYRLRADLVGSYTLPAQEVAYRPAAGGGEPGDAAAGGGGGRVETPALTVEVRSVLPADGSARDIRDIKPLRRVRGPLPWRALAAGTAALLLLAAALWWGRRRLRRLRAPAPPPPPHELALAALAALRPVDADDPAAVRRYYFALSATVRGYVEGRFGLNASDLTTEEIVSRLPRLGGLDAGPAGELEAFLVDTDRVKFANRFPAGDEVGAVWERAHGFVEATRPPAEREEAA